MRPDSKLEHSGQTLLLEPFSSTFGTWPGVSLTILMLRNASLKNDTPEEL